MASKFLPFSFSLSILFLGADFQDNYVAAGQPNRIARPNNGISERNIFVIVDAFRRIRCALDAVSANRDATYRIGIQ